ncbi:hypothetical protein [Thalassotalea sp. PS06]|uniref:hypothetical protein n=1 Tax=Thalassotalea sp. PS06 TaxID=2594005 RepID=UPI001164F8F1|nr:hypothetical protein [Thalassotalea sp. PS06]QDP02167.1 hypothetical protein FNC98_12940 [Thalassotalea sp. PS06]
MKKLLYLLPLLCFLSACSGGGGGDIDTGGGGVQPPPNSAPTLTGTLSFEAKAQTQTDTVYTLVDADGDSISAELVNAPDWLTSSVNGDQLTLTAQPGFFDISNYTFEVKLSDGEDTTSYEFGVSVIDNPEQWGNITPSSDLLAGVWKLENSEDGFHFLENDTGVYAINGELNPFSWNDVEGLKLNVMPVGCTVECAAINELSIVIIAEQDNRLRLAITEGSDTSIVTVEKMTESGSLADTYLDTSASYSGALSVIDKETSIAKLMIKSAVRNKLGNNTHLNSRTGPIIGEYEQMGDKFVINSFENSAFATLDGRFNERSNSMQSHYVNIDLVATQIKITPSFYNHAVYEITYGYQLATDIAPLTPSDLIDYENVTLEETLQQRIQSQSLVIALEPAATPVITAGKSYLGAPIVYDDASILPSLGITFGGNTYQFVTSTEGAVVVEDFDTKQPLEENFSWLYIDNSLALTVDGKVSEHRFYTFPDGTPGMSQERPVENKANWHYLYRFEELVYQPVSEEDYWGTFEDTFVDFFAEKQVDKLTFNADMSGFYVRDILSHREEDGSLSFMYKSGCGELENFSECLQRLKDNNDYYLFRNLKLNKIEGDKYHFMYRLIADGPDENYGYNFQSRRIYRKLSN